MGVPKLNSGTPTRGSQAKQLLSWRLAWQDAPHNPLAIAWPNHHCYPCLSNYSNLFGNKHRFDKSCHMDYIYINVFAGGSFTKIYRPPAFRRLGICRTCVITPAQASSTALLLPNNIFNDIKNVCNLNISSVAITKLHVKIYKMITAKLHCRRDR